VTSGGARLRLAGVLALVLLASAVVASQTAFDGAAALRDVERLVALGPRPAGGAAAARARSYIVGELRAAGIRARVQSFDAETPHGRLRMANVVAMLPGRRPDVILVGGHYDTKLFREFPFVGANDGGSSSALLLQLARRLHARPREFTYWVAWFDGEEAREEWTATDGLYGSRRMADDLQRAGRLPRAVLVADMIGDRNLSIRREAFSTPWLTDLVWASARRLGYGAYFADETLPVEDDHAPFLRTGVPSVLLIDFDYPPWHTAGDTLDKVSARSLEIVGRVLLDALPAIEHRLARTPAGR